MQTVSKITSKGQVTIPKKIRDSLKVAPGDYVQFVIVGDTIVLKPSKTLLDFKGYIKTDRKIDDWEKVRKEAKKAVAKKVLDNLK
ncbi:MAG: AbrB/MazE/SpoVT family DNA-binding domain-containing protein [Deltaproteobacteria bacterium]|nr:AbrB/MazE/SpoVT family DNA-binding domain-containing protein [Deltaproteobacteria bacterium]